MANFLAIHDPDLTRRNAFLNLACHELPVIEGLASKRIKIHNVELAWAANRQAPISLDSHPNSLTVVWGTALQPNGNRLLDAAAVKTAWHGQDTDNDNCFNGYFAALSYDRKKGLAVGADILGVFPIYYYVRANVVMIGSSPELFRHHPLFKTRLNPVTLVSVLMLAHPLEGDTLWEGVRRLGAGCILRVDQQGNVSEEKVFNCAPSTAYYDLPFSAHVNILGQSLERAILQQVDPAIQHSLMLSGGLDSRMVAGYLREANVSVSPVTFGQQRDIEVACAQQVAAALNVNLNIQALDLTRYPHCAQLQAKWEHGITGFNTIHTWQSTPHLARIAPRSISGYMLDAVVGSHYLTWGYSSHDHTMSFDRFFQHANTYGIKLPDLRRLLQPDGLSDTVDEVLSRMRTSYQRCGETHSQRAWCFNLLHRQRFHVGPILWRLSFGAWPVTPALNQNLLRCAGGMPASTIGERRAQKELLCQRFPKLASLPLDRNSIHTTPLRPRTRYQIKQYFRCHLQPFIRAWYKVAPQVEQRRYYRLYDINSPAWKSVRELAECGRPKVLKWFNEQALADLLPKPDKPIAGDDTINGASGLKSLLGIMLWSQDHL